MKKLLLVLAFLIAAPAPLLAQAGPSAFTTGYRYDADRRLVGTIEPDPDGAGPLHYAATRNTYDVAGRLVTIQKGELAAWQPETVAPANWAGFTVLQRTDYVYDALDRKTVEATDLASTTFSVAQYSYDPAGRPDCTAVRMNPATWGTLPACSLTAAGSYGSDRITHNNYDAAGQLLSVQRAYGTPLQQTYVTYEYTPNGKQKAVIDADLNRAEMTYDAQDRQQRWIFPSPTTHGLANGTATSSTGDFEEYSYDANGNRLTLRKRDGTTIVYQYDALNRLTQKIVPTSVTGAAGYSVFQGYDNRGLLLYARFGSATGLGITNVYDNMGQLTSSTTSMDGTNRTFTSTYDADGNRKTLTSSEGYSAAFDPDGLDRMAAARESGISGPVVATIAYDPLERRGSLGQGPAGTTTSSTAYAYDGASRLQTLTHDLAGTGNDQVLGFGYNPASQIVGRTRSNSGWEYTEAVPGTKSYAANGLNQYLSAGTNTYLYDANGNLRSDGTRTYIYDAENRLVSVTGDISSTLSYDPMGRLWRLTGPVSTDLRFVYDGDRLTEELNAAGVVQRDYIFGPGADEPLLWNELTGGTVHHFLHADHQGSIVAVADDSGNALAIDKYDEWGVPALGNIGRFQYTGQAWLADLGLYYYKARMYSSRLGRFLQTDPVGYKDQVNLYAYVGNDPVDGRDPSGECQDRDSDGECIVKNKAGAAGAAAAEHLQAQVRRVDHAIQGLDPKQKIQVNIGRGQTREMTGAQIAKAWARTTWTVDPHAPNRFGAGITGSGHFSGTPEYLESFRQSAKDWHRDEDEATRSVVLHDFGHSTPLGHDVISMYNHGSQFDERERATSRIGRAIGAAIGETFECRTFGNGCGP